MKKSDIPNLISFIRVLLIMPVVWTMLQHRYDVALALFVVAGLSDALDGYLARKYHWGSHLGGWLDPLADKAMQVSAYITLTWLGWIPLWLLAAVIIRDLLIVCGGVYYYYRVERANAAPMLIGKINTLVQILLVIVILMHQGLFAFPPGVIDMLFFIVLATTVLSGLDYVLTWGRKAVRIKRVQE
ncbi:MAG TPA: CDP-alcohol phosphatidyltransferase family protein [Gammaproteobacteria bacterium]|nr:CDP-alcohol phosphatidyltransferase family protein [Gammaproteobacteria bacterium]